MRQFSGSCVLFSGVVAVGIATWASAQTWDAAVDLRANELNGSNELLNPNATVPEWSYGTRATPAATALALFDDHSNEVISGNTSTQGWLTAGGSLGIPFVFVDVSQPVPTLLGMHPGGGTSAVTSYEVVRWTAPFAGLYDITAFWTDAHIVVGNTSDDGGDAYVVLNGVAQTGFVGSNVFGQAGTATYLNSLTLAAGDTLDFVLGSGLAGTNFADSTNFNAVITAVPEPASLALVGLMGLLATRRRGR